MYEEDNQNYVYNPNGIHKNDRMKWKRTAPST